VIHKLRHAGVLVRSADLDLDNDPTDGFGGNGFERFTHEKYMILSGGYGSTSSRIVWTGSENWSDKSPKNDEVNVRIPRNGAYHRYRDNFNWIWAHGSRRY
jgi:phosphatidylserine/phosphatidylglycerophosphate/cardiolipin synthase-like enzyme